MLNKIILTGTISYINEATGLYYLTLPNKKHPIHVQYKNKQTFNIGDVVRVSGQLASSEVNFPFPCHGEVGANFTFIRTFIKAENMMLENKNGYNYCELEGVVVSTPKPIEIYGQPFSSIRIRLDNELGFASVNIPYTDAEQLPQLYDRLSVCGHLKTKDLEKQRICPICGTPLLHSFLTVWVKAKTFEFYPNQV